MAELEILGPATEADHLEKLGPAPSVPNESIDAGDVDHAAFAARVERGTVLARIWDAFKDGAKEGFGGEPLGFDPNGEAQKFLQSHGIFADPSNQRFGDAIRTEAESTARPLAAVADIFARLPGAVVGGIADAVEEYNKNPDGSLSGSNEGGAIRSAFSWAMSDAPLTRSTVTDGFVRDEPIGTPPKPADFAATAQAMHPGDQAAAAITADKLTGLYQEYGVHPNEVLSDAKRDPRLAADLASDNPMLPTRYTGLDPLAMTKAQIEADTAAGAPPKKIAGVTDELNDALPLTEA